jgi:hypothetical protein
MIFALFSLMASSASAVRLYLTEVAVCIQWKALTVMTASISALRMSAKRTGQLMMSWLFHPRHVVLFPADTEAYSISHRENFTDDDGLILAEVTQFPVVVVAKSGTAMTSFDDVIAQSQDKE